MSSALAVHMATQQVPTLVVSTDPAHSLSDSLAQDVSGGVPVRVSGTEAPLWALEIEPKKARAELRALAQGDGGDKAIEMLSSVGLGALADQLKARSLLPRALRLPLAHQLDARFFSPRCGRGTRSLATVSGEHAGQACVELGREPQRCARGTRGALTARASALSARRTSS